MWNKLPNRKFWPRRLLSGRALWIGLVVGLTVPWLQGCIPALLGGAAVGASVAHERRSARTVLGDEHIEHSVAQLLNDHPAIKQHSRIGATSYNYRVLLTGQAETREIGYRLARKVANLPRVKKVINGVTIGPVASLTRESEDVVITSRVKLALTKIDIPGFDATRVKVVTEAGTVFLMGLVYPKEGNAAVEQTRRVPGVTKVVKIFEYIEP